MDYNVSHQYKSKIESILGNLSSDHIMKKFRVDELVLTCFMYKINPDDLRDRFF